ncbi:unnamed protein product, partial [Gongylonema pulchrum]|uniref:Secreted protein n=1 Tax=Gongylonema pulchrum TaxID=637853 RepID=A0A183DEI7_9BILA
MFYTHFIIITAPGLFTSCAHKSDPSPSSGPAMVFAHYTMYAARWYSPVRCRIHRIILHFLGNMGESVLLFVRLSLYCLFDS